MIVCYMLDENNNPVPTTDVLEWARWRANADVVVAKTDVGKVRVSTVFLGIPHCDNRLDNLNAPDPVEMLYETMCFGPDELLARITAEDHDGQNKRSIFSVMFGGVDVQVRYRTREEAVTGHEEMVSHVRRVLAGRN